MSTPAGWYPISADQSLVRYWDGYQWLDHYRRWDGYQWLDVGLSTPPQPPRETYSQYQPQPSALQHHNGHASGESAQRNSTKVWLLSSTAVALFALVVGGLYFGITRFA